MTRSPGHRPVVALAAAVALAALSVGAASPAAEAQRSSSTAILDWDEAAGRAAVAARQVPFANPFHESRSYAMGAIAAHDAVNAIDRRFESYAVTFTAPRGASVDAAVAAAEHDALVAGFRAATGPFADCAGAGIAVLDDFYARSVAAIPEGAGKAAGLAAGRRAAAASVARRASDGSHRSLFDADFPQGHQARRIPVHPRLRLRLCHALGRGHAVRAAQRLAVQGGACAAGGQRPLRPGPQRGQGLRR